MEDPHSEAAALFNMGQIYAVSGEKQKSAEHYNLSLTLRREIDDREGEAHTLSGLGVMHKDAGEIPKALELYKQALSLMREVGHRAGEAMVLDNIAHAYSSLGEKEKALEHFTQARSLAEAAGDRRRVALSLGNIGLFYELQGRLGAALDYYQQSLKVDETIRADVKLDEFKSRLTEKSVPTYARAVSLNLNLGNSAEAFNLTERSRARTFLDQVGNVRLNLRKGADSLLIQQEQTLRSELTALDHSLIKQKRKRSGERLLALTQGQAEGLPFLRHAEQETRAIAALYNTRALVGSAATESILHAQAGNFDILHLAAHGQLNPASPLFSRIVLAPDKDADGSLDVREVYGLDLAQTSLVVLSACQTQLGAQSRGDDIIGLNRAFIYAGTPTVVASLWRVDDAATGLLMKSFYTHLKQGKSKAAALQAAQRETRAKYPHPYYWAVFVLTGDPGTMASAKSVRN